MKKSIAVLAMLMAVAIPSRAFADNTLPPVEKRVEKLTTELNLTPDQQKSVKETLEAKREKMKSISKDDHEAWRKLTKETNDKINAVLTPEQQKKFATMQKEMKKKHRDEHKEHKQK